VDAPSKLEIAPSLEAMNSANISENYN